MMIPNLRWSRALVAVFGTVALLILGAPFGARACDTCSSDSLQITGVNIATQLTVGSSVPFTLYYSNPTDKTSGYMVCQDTQGGACTSTGAALTSMGSGAISGSYSCPNQLPAGMQFVQDVVTWRIVVPSSPQSNTFVVYVTCNAQQSPQPPPPPPPPAPQQNSPPVALPNASDLFVKVGDTVSFYSTSYDPDQGDSITQEVWNFGDGATAIGKTVAHAYSSAGTFSVLLTVTDSHGASNSKGLSITVQAPPQPTPSPQPPPPSPTQPAPQPKIDDLMKKWKQQQTKSTDQWATGVDLAGNSLAAICGLLAFLGAPIEPVILAACGVLAAGLKVSSSVGKTADKTINGQEVNGLRSAALSDSPDPNFMEIALPTPPPYTPLTAGPGISQNLADAVNALLSNQTQQVGLLNAYLTSLNRARGAEIAGNTEWTAKHMDAFAQYSSQLAPLISAQTQLYANLQSVWQTDNLPDLQITADQVSQMQAKIATDGLPPFLMNALTQMGADSATIEQFRTALMTQAPQTLVGSVFGDLTDPELNSAAQGAASAFQSISQDSRQFAEAVGSSPPSGGGSSLKSFDKNNNNHIEDAEFFSIIDAWIAGQMKDTLFFHATDLWISQGSITSATIPQKILHLSSVALTANLASHEMTLTAHGQGITAMAVEVFNANSERVFAQEATGTRLSWNLSAPSGVPAANGVYLYSVTVRGMDGEKLQSAIMKLVVLR